MDIQSTAISAKLVIQSLIKVLENEGVDAHSIKFKIGSTEEGCESEDLDFGKLIDLTLKELEEAKDQAVPEGYVLVKDEPVAYMVQNKFWKGEFEVKLLSEMPELEFDGDSYDVEIPLYMIEAQEPTND